MAMHMKQISSSVPIVKLNSGYEIGYRHFDIAAAYGSEEALGQAVAGAIQRGLIKSREQVFITSKLWCTETHRDLVLPTLKKNSWEAEDGLLGLIPNTYASDIDEEG